MVFKFVQKLNYTIMKQKLLCIALLALGFSLEA